MAGGTPHDPRTRDHGLGVVGQGKGYKVYFALVSIVTLIIFFEWIF